MPTRVAACFIVALTFWGCVSAFTAAVAYSNVWPVMVGLIMAALATAAVSISFVNLAVNGPVDAAE